VTAYATQRDLYTYGLRRGVLSNPGREIETSIASTNVLTLDAHLFETDDQVTLRAIEGGTLSAPLVAGTSYFVIKLTDATFSLALTSGGAAIDLTTNGITMIVKPSTLPIDELLEAYSRFVDDFVPSHAVPMPAPYDKTLVRIVSELTAAKLLSLTGQSSASMAEAELAAKAQLERWAKGLPLRAVEAANVSTNRAVTSDFTAVSDPRGWSPSAGSGTLP